MKTLFSTLLVVAVLVTGAFAQVRPTTNSAEPARGDASATNVTVQRDRKILDKIAVKYKGGLFGYSKSEHGTLEFDKINERLMFIGKDGKERFSLPFNAIVVVYPSQRKVQSGTGRAVGAIPIPGAALGGLFIKKKKNYLIINYSDRDVNANGTLNFIVDTGEMLHDSIYTIGENAEMKPRGDAYVRRAQF